MAATWTPKFEGKSDKGLPLVYGRLETYAAGTSTPLATYTDATGGTQNTNPVILDAAGRANVWLQSNVQYKLVLKSVLGVVIWTVDFFSVADPAFAVQLDTALKSATGSSLIGFQQAGAGAIRESVQDAIRRQFVSPYSFGWTGDNVATDTIALQAAIAQAVASKRFLDLLGSESGWPYNAELDMTGLSGVVASFDSPLLPDSAGTYPTGWAVRFGDPTTTGDLGRSNGLSILGHLHVAANNRNTGLSGVYFKGSLQNIGSISAQNFKGTGIYADSVWDSTVASLSVDNCGTPSAYALIISSNGDTNNCTHYGRLQCEAAMHKGMDLNLIRCTVGPIHAERLRVLTLNDGTPTLPNGLTYTNHRITTGNTAFTQVQIDAAPTGTVTPEGNTLSGRALLTIYGDAAEIGPLEMGAADVVVTGGEGLTLNTLTVDRIYQVAPASNTRLSALKANLLSGESGITVESPRFIQNFTPSFNGVLQKVLGGTIGTVNFSNAILGDISFIGCKIDQVLDTLGATGPGRENTSFTDCEINSWPGAFNARARVLGGYINTAALVSQAAPEFYNVQFGAFSHTGNTGYITQGCRASTVTSWDFPHHVNYPAGTRTERIGYASGQGDRYVNINNAVNWTPLGLMP